MNNNNNNNYILSPLQQSTGLHPGWLSGFIDSDGSFGVVTSPTKIARGFSVTLTFTLGQHINDSQLFTLFPIFFGAGGVYIKQGRLVVYTLSQINPLETQLFPLLAAHPLMTQKRHYFEDFKRVHAMIKRKEHLTVKGVEEIRIIKAGINRGRL